MDNSQPNIIPISAPTILYKFRICHSHTRTLVPGVYFSSPEFIAAGLKWVLQYFPSGLQHTPDGFCSVLLKLVSDSKPVKATVQFGIIRENDRLHWYGLQSHCSIMTGSCGGPGDVIGIERYLIRALLEQIILPYDHFAITYSLTILEGGHTEEAVPVPLPIENEVPEFNLVAQLSNMLRSGEMADVTFDVGGQKFQAHRSILVARSPVFKAELFGPMCEGKDTSIKIYEMNPVVFNALLQYIYTDSITEASGEEENILDPTMPWATFTHYLLVAADRYAVEGLRKICQKKACKDVCFETVLDVLCFADCHSFDLLKESCLNFMAEPQNIAALACTQGYMQVMLNSPSLLAKMQEKISQRDVITPDFRI